MESKKINQLATELAPDLSDLTIIGDPTTGISKKITLSQMASLFTGTVEEYANFAAFPLVGVADTIYVAKDTNVIYRWDSTAYVVLSPNIIASLVFNDANGFDGNIALVGSVATLTITTALTTGSVGFIGASGALLQDNANFFWDDTNNRLGLGTNAPTTALDVFGSGIIGRINGTSTNNAYLGFSSAGTNKWSVGNVQSDHRFRIFSEANSAELITILQTGEFGIGIANPTTKFHIDGAASALIANLDANVSVAKSISFRSDNSNRINLEVSGTESGSNAGADFFIRRYSDAGSLIDTPLTITRSTGNATFSGILTTPQVKAATSAGLSINANSGTQVADFGAGGSANITFFGGLSGTSASFSSTATATAFIPSGATIPTNGMYLSAANTLNFATNTTNRLTITSAGNVGIGITPSAWISTAKALQLNDTASLFGPTSEAILANNLFVDSTDTNKYITTNFASQYRQVNGQHIFYTAASGTAGTTISFGTPKLIITSGGNVGIGTSSPNLSGNTLNLTIVANSTTQGGVLELASFNLTSTTGELGKIEFLGLNGSNTIQSRALIVSNQEGTTTSSNMRFFTMTGGTIGERMRIRSEGNIGIGTGGLSDWRLYVKGIDTTSSNGAFIVQNNADTMLLSVRNDGLFGSGTAANSPYNLTVTGRDCYIDNTGYLGYLSSVRESKININNIENVDWLLNLNPVSFNKRKKDEAQNYTEEFYEELDYGLIAEEAELINDQICFYDETEEDRIIRGISYSKLITPMLKMIQQQQEQINELKGKIK